MCEASAANHKMSRVPSRTTRFNFNNIYTDLLSWKEFPPISNSRLRVFETLGFVPKIETKVKIFSYAKIIGGYIFVYLSSWIFVSKYWARIEESLLLLADIFTFVLESNVFHEFFFPRIARIHNLPFYQPVNAKNCETQFVRLNKFPSKSKAKKKF